MKVILIETTDEQKDNLKKLADYLAALPEDYEHFDMTWFYTGAAGFIDDVRNVSNQCGTCACALGHGVAAGIEPSVDDCGFINWRLYGKKFTGGNLDLWRWLFDPEWSNVDNTPRGAAKRVYFYLKHGGVPDDYMNFPTDYQEDVLP